jgi:hypothetical protein
VKKREDAKSAGRRLKNEWVEFEGGYLQSQKSTVSDTVRRNVDVLRKED